jgi:hypothetical protein
MDVFSGKKLQRRRVACQALDLKVRRKNCASTSILEFTALCRTYVLRLHLNSTYQEHSTSSLFASVLGTSA